MEAPPDAPIAGHTQGDNIGQRARQQAKAAHVNRRASSIDGGT